MDADGERVRWAKDQQRASVVPPTASDGHYYLGTKVPHIVRVAKCCFWPFLISVCAELSCRGNITSPRREFPWLRKPDLKQLQGVTATREFAQILDIALRFAAQGREGKPIGTIFVLGALGQVSPFLRQLILNPFEGHSPESRNIHNPDFLETLREFAAMDGAFVVNHAGDVEFGGTYIDAPATEARLREGLGARHAAAAAITAATPAVAVVVSESSGDVTVFHEGQAILKLEKLEVIVGPEG